MEGWGVEVTGCMRGVSSVCSQAQRRGADGGRSSVAQRGRQTVIMEEGEQGPGHPSAILFGSAARWAQDAEAGNPGPGPSSLLCVLGHGT